MRWIAAGCGSFGKRRRRGVALIMVIVVLMALLVIATPFSISMRDYSEASTDLLNRTRAQRECASARKLAIEALAATHPSVDTVTPLFDAPDELGLRLDPALLGFDVSDPRGRIWTVRTADLQGRVDLNTASIYLLANLLGLRTRLSGDLAPEDTEAAVMDTEPFPDAGTVWVEGEGLLYDARSPRALEELKRPAALPGLEQNRSFLHPAGAEVIGFQAFLAATYCYKWMPGRFSSFPTEEALRNIALLGDVSLERDRFDRIADLVTVYASPPGGRRFVNPRRVLRFGGREAPEVLVVDDARYMGAGSIVRVRAGASLHYSLVLRAAPLPGEHAWSVLLQEPVPFETEEGEGGVVDVLARRPVNVNSAPLEVLEAVLTGIALSREGLRWVDALEHPEPPAVIEGGTIEASGGGGAPAAGSEGPAPESTDVVSAAAPAAASSRISPKAARAVAEALRSRPVKGFADLDARLRELSEGEGAVITRTQRWAILLNALNASDAYVVNGTAPFCFDAGGTFRIDTAVSDNYPSGREAARYFMRDVVRPTPPGPLALLFATQETFEAQRRLTREGRGYLTLPVSLAAAAEEDPPSLAPAIMLYGSPPSGEVKAAGVQLAPARVEGDRVIHFDGGDIPLFTSGAAQLLPPLAGEGDLYREVFGDPLGFHTGDRVVVLDPEAEPAAAVLGGPYARVWPFSVELWYRFDETDKEHYLFDCGVEGREENNRISLFYDGKDLVFRVADVTLPTSTLNSDEPLEIAEIRYDFKDLPLEPGVFYHFACMTAGTKPSDLALFVDGVARGKRTFQTRLAEPLAAVSGQSGLPGNLGARDTIKVEDASSFPERGVLRIGGEIVEYTSRTEDTFIAEPLEFQPFGGRNRRAGKPGDHPATETVELYGYTTPLLSERIPRGEAQLAQPLGRFWVAMVDPEGSGLETESILVKPRNANGIYKSITLGQGFFTEPAVKMLPLKNLDNTPISADASDAFSKNGGYAIVFTEFPTKHFTLQFKNENQTLNEQVDIIAGDTRRPLSDSPKEGYLVNGYAVCHYQSFTGSSLQGITWASAGEGGYPKGKPRALIQEASTSFGEGAGQAGGDQGRGSAFDFLAKRCFVTRYEKGVLGSGQGGGNQNQGQNSGTNVQDARVFVIPISVGIGTSGDLFQAFHPDPNYAGDRPRPELVQVGLDFNGSGKDETEWIRYDSIEQDLFIREDPQAIVRTWTFLSSPSLIDATLQPEVDQVVDRVNRDLRFRAQLGTPHSSHSAGSMVLPVVRFETNFEARPGRYDTVTLVAADERAEPESAVINHCNDRPSPGAPPYRDRDWGNCAMVAFRKGVLGEYVRQEYDFGQIKSEIQKGIATGEGLGEALATAWGIESRDLTRMVKFPSGELPDKAPDVFVLGGTVTGEPSPGRGVMDEVRLKRFQTPTPPGKGSDDVELPRFARFVLGEELEEEETTELRLRPDALRYNRRLLWNPLLEGFEILNSLPADAGLLQIGDEVLAYTDVDVEEGIVTLAPDGRGLFGTEPGYHRPLEPVLLLNFPELTILDHSLTARGGILEVKDTAGFPFEGAVLVDHEVVGYTRREEDALLMPERPQPGLGAVGLLRGRYGTDPEPHPSGSVVLSLPVRYPDRYVPGADFPEASYFPFGVEAPGAFFNRLTWKEERPGEGADLVLLCRVGRKGSWADDPEKTPDLFRFEAKAGTDLGGPKGWLRRQGDLLQVRVYTRYAPGAFDPLDFSSNAWKYAPVLRWLGVEYVQPTQVVRHEEWR